MRHGETSSTNITVINYGESASYSLSVTVQVSGRNETTNTEDFFTYMINPNIVTLESNSSASVVFNVNLFEDAYDAAMGLIFTIIIESLNNRDNNNFIEIDILSISPSEIVTSSESVTSETTEVIT